MNSGGRRISPSSLALSVAAMIVGPTLLWALLRWTKISPSDLWALLSSIAPGWALTALCATAAQLVIGGVKWRLVEARLTGTPPDLARAALYSMVGAGVSQILPTPLASAVVRGGGNHLSAGGGAWRGALTSVWEQLFDLGLFALLAPASLMAIVLRETAWFVLLGAVMVLAADRLIGPLVRAVGRTVRIEPLILDPALTRLLFRLSVVRFLLMAVVAWASAQAAGGAIHAIQLAPTLAPVGLANTLSFLPAGLGVSEWGYVVLLHALGSTAAAATTFSLINRALVSGSSILLAGVGAMGLIVSHRTLRGGEPN